MTRQIKFRAWIGSEEDKSMSRSFEIIEAERILNPFWDEPLMQFTGLLDRKGKEIYEGDIISLGRKIRIIEWRPCKHSIGFNLGSVNSKREIPIDVIGNIYENPGLLSNK